MTDLETHVIVKINDLTFSYDKINPVLEAVNLDIRENEIVTVTGPNGGGKTTLLRLVLGLLQPDRGSIRIEGKSPVTSQGRIGYVPQHSDFDRQFPITVFEVVLSGLVKPFGFYSRTDKQKALDALEDVGLSDLRDKNFSNISGGQQQRMLIARALVSEKDILLLDEPTSNIDSETEDELNSLIKELSSRMAIVLVTHDVGFVSNITDRVFCVNRKIVEHPLDDDFDSLVASSYGEKRKLIRHDKNL